jgi:hypothetical protein
MVSPGERLTTMLDFLLLAPVASGVGHGVIAHATALRRSYSSSHRRAISGSIPSTPAVAGGRSEIPFAMRRS